MRTPLPFSQFLAYRGWTQSEFARFIGCHQPAITAIAAGRQWPRLKTRQRITKALCITNDELVAMLEASAELALLEDRQRFARSVAEMVRLAKRITKPEPVVVAVARSGKSALTRLIRRGKSKVTIIVPRSTAAA